VRVGSASDSLTHCWIRTTAPPPMSSPSTSANSMIHPRQNICTDTSQIVEHECCIVKPKRLCRSRCLRERFGHLLKHRTELGRTDTLLLDSNEIGGECGL
jgi:hypothetical protein